MRYIAALIERLLIKCEGVHDLVDLDGNIYTTIIIGYQEWILENLRVTQYSNRTTIPYLTLNDDWITDITGAYCWYNNNIGNKTPYGALYNWYAVNNAHGLAYLERGGVQEVGWRVPTEPDFDSLITFLGGGPISGGKLKEIGIIHWDTPNTGADNSSGFTALGTGYREGTTGEFGSLGLQCGLWSSTIRIDYPSFSYNLLLNHDSAIGNLTNTTQKNGFSIRLVRDI